MIAPGSLSLMIMARSLGAYVYRPFVYPMPIWDWWPATLLPLTIGMAIVYKSIKCNDMKQVPRAALGITIWILVGMVAAAGLLAGMLAFIER